MRGGSIVREARLRAGLRQAELASRLGTTQSAIARLERGRAEPGFERVVEAVRACGLDFVPTLRSADEANWSLAATNLSLSVDDRVRQHQAALTFAIAGREAAAHD